MQSSDSLSSLILRLSFAMFLISSLLQIQSSFTLKSSDASGGSRPLILTPYLEGGESSDKSSGGLGPLIRTPYQERGESSDESSGGSRPLIRTPYLERGESSDESSGGSGPLILTPYLERGEIQLARELSQVSDLPGAPSTDIQSYSGFFTVNKKHDSHLFFWFFPAQNRNIKAPFIVWLQGGPGSPGLEGLFIENGPYEINRNLTVNLREHTWTEEFHVLYIDNPVGTGFSYTSDGRGYSSNQEQIAENLYEFLNQFFVLFREYGQSDLYISGESYGGKYAPSLAYKIHTDGAPAELKLKGISIGNGASAPEYMVDYGDYFYQIGLVDRNQRLVLNQLRDRIVEDIRQGKFYRGLKKFSKVIGLYPHIEPLSYMQDWSGYTFFYNFLHTKRPKDYDYYKDYVKRQDVRKAIHVGNSRFHKEEVAQKSLTMDIMKSVRDKFEVLMDNYKVLFYNGELDLVIPYPLTANFLHHLNWRHADEYKKAEKRIWVVNGTDWIGGYFHQVGDFCSVMVRAAGHLVPHDQPKAAKDLITRFIKNVPLA